VRKATLRPLLVKVGPDLQWNEHIEGDGETIFRHLQARLRRHCFARPLVPLLGGQAPCVVPDREQGLLIARHPSARSLAPDDLGRGATMQLVNGVAIPVSPAPPAPGGWR